MCHLPCLKSSPPLLSMSSPFSKSNMSLLWKSLSLEISLEPGGNTCHHRLCVFQHGLSGGRCTIQSLSEKENAKQPSGFKGGFQRRVSKETLRFQRREYHGKDHQSHWCWRNWESSPWKGEALHTSPGRSFWELYIGETRKRGGFTLRGDTATTRGPEGRSPLLLPSPAPLHSRHCLPSAKLSSRCAGPGTFQHTADREEVLVQIWGTEAQEEQRLL